MLLARAIQVIVVTVVFVALIFNAVFGGDK